VLWGDSNAAQWGPTLQAQRNFRLAEFTESLCIPALGFSETDRPYCNEINTYVARRIASLHPYEVLLSAAWTAYPSYAINNDLANTINYLKQDDGVKHIVIVGQSPAWSAPLPAALYQYGIFHPKQALPVRMNFDYSRAIVQSASVLVARVSHRLEVPYVQVTKVLCNSDGCLTRVGNKLSDITQFDEDHLTRAGADYLFSRLHSVLVPGIPSS
jgi:lysophospholipase L1-like esterase